MANKTEVLGALKKAGDKMKSIFGVGKKTETTALNIERVLEDGRKLEIATTNETIQDGDAVTVVGGGELLDGTYKMADGMTITIKDGKVAPAPSDEPFPLVAALGLNSEMSEEDKTKLETILAENAAKYKEEAAKNAALNTENEEIKAAALALADEVECMPNTLPKNDVVVLNRADKNKVDEDDASIESVLARRKAEREAIKNKNK